MPRMLFEHPPVFEVVFSVQLDGRLPLKAFDVPKIHQAVADMFPEVVEQPPLERINFPNQPSITVELETPRIRWWFLSKDGHKLIQLQDDRFLLNWRGLEAPLREEYPGYDALRREFLELFTLFEATLKELGIGSLNMHSCEMAYVNLIAIDPSKDNKLRLNEHVTFMGFPEEHFIRALNMNWIYDIRENDGKVVEFYKASAAMGSTPDERPALHLTLEGTSRVEESLEIHFDRIHANIHNYFLELTTDIMHQKWKKK